MPRHEDRRPEKSAHGNSREEEDEVSSPLKNQNAGASGGDTMQKGEVGRQLFQSQKGGTLNVLRKRKAKGSGGSSSSLTPDLTIPADETPALVPAGLVSQRVNQLGKSSGEVGTSASEASPKKQKKSKPQTTALSAGAADGSSRRAK